MMPIANDDPAYLRAEVDRIWSELERRLKVQFVALEVFDACKSHRGRSPLIEALAPRLFVDRNTFKVSVLDVAGKPDPRMSATDLVAEFCADPAFAPYLREALR